jgi:hypothetical protein
MDIARKSRVPGKLLFDLATRMPKAITTFKKTIPHCVDKIFYHKALH